MYSTSAAAAAAPTGPCASGWLVACWGALHSAALCLPPHPPQGVFCVCFCQRTKRERKENEIVWHSAVQTFCSMQGQLLRCLEGSGYAPFTVHAVSDLCSILVDHSMACMMHLLRCFRRIYHTVRCLTAISWSAFRHLFR